MIRFRQFRSMPDIFFLHIAHFNPARANTVHPDFRAEAYGHGLLRTATALAPVTDGFALIEFDGKNNHSLLLQDTGLFEETPQRKLRAASVWLQEQLIVGFSQAQRK